MPDPAIRYSINEFTGDGVTTQRNISFAGGYLLGEHVKSYYTTALGVEITVPLTFISTGVVSTAPIVVPAGLTHVIYRSTPFDAPLADFTDGAVITETNLDANARQAIFVAAELTDQFNEQVDDAAISASAALASETAAETAALSATLDAANSTSAASASAASAAAASASAGASSASAATAAGYVANLASPVGAGLVGFLPAGSLARETTLDKHIDRQRVSVFSFLTEAQQLDVIAGTPSLDVRAAIESAEKYAADLAVITVAGVELWWPLGCYGISAPINKKSRVHWRGFGEIQRLGHATATGAAFALVYANAVNDWSIVGLSLRNVTRTQELAAAMTWAVTPSFANSCIDAFGCSRFRISECTLRQFTFGIVYRQCVDSKIENNWLYADTGKTAAQIDDNTYTHFASFIAGSGGIVVLYNGNGTVHAVSRNMAITGNHIEVAGLDIAIEALGLSWDAQRSLIHGNTVYGCTTGIQAYRGSIVDLGGAPTYNSGLIISGNRVMLSWGAGLYMRSVIGGQVFGNTFERCGKIGTDGAASSGSMVFRVNPFATAPVSSVSNDHAMLVFGNRVIDHGREDVTCDPAVLIEYDGVRFTGNEISRSDERFNTARGHAINLANGKSLRSVVVKDNVITGKWTTGILLSDILRTTSITTHWAEISGNTLNGDFTLGIEANWNAFNVAVKDNLLTGTFTDGIKLTGAPLSVISGNRVSGTITNGITLGAGSLLSDIPKTLSAGTITSANRRGASLTVEGNDVWGATTPYQIVSSSGSDAFFWSRCHNFERNFIQGQPVVHEFGTGGTPGLTNAPKVWHKQETTRNSTLAAATSIGKICSSPGQGGATTTATGNTTISTPTVSGVSSLDGWGPGIYLTMPQFTGTRKIVSIDTVAGTITLDANATATATGATITPATPAFLSLPVAAA